MSIAPDVTGPALAADGVAAFAGGINRRRPPPHRRSAIRSGSTEIRGATAPQPHEERTTLGNLEAAARGACPAASARGRAGEGADGLAGGAGLAQIAEGRRGAEEQFHGV